MACTELDSVQVHVQRDVRTVRPMFQVSRGLFESKGTYSPHMVPE